MTKREALTVLVLLLVVALLCGVWVALNPEVLTQR